MHEKVIQRGEHGRRGQNQPEKRCSEPAEELRVLPTVMPSHASTEHHSSDPARVASGIPAKVQRRMPAGMPMRWRITGSSREKNTPADS